MITGLFYSTTGASKRFGISKSFGYLNMELTKGICIHVFGLNIIFSKQMNIGQSEEVKEFHSKK